MILEIWIRWLSFLKTIALNTAIRAIYWNCDVTPNISDISILLSFIAKLIHMTTKMHICIQPCIYIIQSCSSFCLFCKKVEIPPCLIVFSISFLLLNINVNKHWNMSAIYNYYSQNLFWKVKRTFNKSSN